jgi:hypothetical protein
MRSPAHQDAVAQAIAAVTADGPPIVIGIVTLLSIVGCVLAVSFGPRRPRRARGARRRSDDLAALDDEEKRARAAMDELCPQGWRADITIYGWGAPIPKDAPPSRTPQICVEWGELREGMGDPWDDELHSTQMTVVRRVWAPTVKAALWAMVRDRGMDAALEEIERGVDFDDLAE